MQLAKQYKIKNLNTPFENSIGINNFLEVTKKQKKFYLIFLTGIIIYVFSYTLSMAGQANYVLFQAFQFIGLALTIISSINISNFKIDNQYLRFLFFLYCIWHLIMILMGSHFTDYNFLKIFFLHLGMGGIIYFVPLVLFLPKKVEFYKTIFNIIIFFSLFYLVYDYIYKQNLLNPNRSSITSMGIVELSADLGFPAGFLLLTYAYHTNKKLFLAGVVIALTLLFGILRARRGLIFMCSGIIISSYIIFLFTSKKRFQILYLSLLLMIFGAFYTSTLYNTDKSIFGPLIERKDDDTRSPVEDFFYADMKTNDWIFGRGLNGEYFCPDIEPDQVTNYRTVIETGYLQIILKGGIISLALLLLITIPAIFKGLFYSKNILSKAAGIWIFLALISLYPAQVTTFSLRYILVWICVGICYSKEIRNIPEKKMQEYFQPVK